MLLLNYHINFGVISDGGVLIPLNLRTCYAAEISYKDLESNDIETLGNETRSLGTRWHSNLI